MFCFVVQLQTNIINLTLAMLCSFSNIQLQTPVIISEGQRLSICSLFFLALQPRSRKANNAVAKQQNTQHEVPDPAGQKACLILAAQLKISDFEMNNEALFLLWTMIR